MGSTFLLHHTARRTEKRESNIFIMLKHVAVIFIIFSSFGVLCQDNTTMPTNVTTPDPSVTISQPIVTTLEPNVTTSNPNVTTPIPETTTQAETTKPPEPIITSATTEPTEPSASMKNTFKIVLLVFIMKFI